MAAAPGAGDKVLKPPARLNDLGKDFSMPITTGTRHVMISSLALAATSAAFGVIMLASSPTSSASAGMERSGSTPTPTMAADMPGMDMSGSTPTPTMTDEMPGMDMSGSTPTPTPTGAMSGDMPGMDMPGSGHDHGSSAAVSDRPLAPVLGTFGGGASAVMLTAGLLRRKDRAASAAKVATHAAGKARK